MNYLQLVNKVIQESSSEQDELTSGTWASAEAGRRIYPRIKRNVKDAWKLIQMSRNEWEFNTGSFSSVLYPRVRITDGFRAAGAPPVGSVFVGDDSLFSLTVKAVSVEGSWASGTAEGYIEFQDYERNGPIPGENFTEESPVSGDGTFTYLGKGSYNFQDVDASVREPQWDSFYTNQTNSTPARVFYVPWDNWEYSDQNFNVSSQTGPTFVSQDFEGNTVFYPQTFTPFRVNFIYNAAPQELVDWDDEVLRLPEEYHDWIAWRALMLYAVHDKNPPLFAYAKEQEGFFRYRAERNLMPLVAHARGPFR